MDTVAALLDALHARDEDRIEETLEQLLDEGGSGEAMGRVALSMDDAELEVAARTGEVVRDLAEALPVEPAVPPLVRAARHDDPAVRRAAWEAFDEVVRHLDLEDVDRHVTPLLADADPAHSLAAVRAAGKRGVDVTAALPGLVTLMYDGEWDEAAAAMLMLPELAEAGTDLAPMGGDLRHMVDQRAAEGEVDPELAEALVHAELGRDRFDRLDALLDDPVPEVRRATRSVAAALLDAAARRARETGDTDVLRDVTTIRKHLRGRR